MGTVIAISCSSCSYSNELRLGIGELGIESKAMICHSCNRLTAVPVNGDAERYEKFAGEPLKLGACPWCGSEELRHAEIGDGRFGVPGPAITKELCPACRRGMLLTQWRGIWD